MAWPCPLYREAQQRAIEQHPHARKQGGRVPHGYRRVRDGLEVDPEAAAEVRRAFELVRDGRSIRAAAALLGLRPSWTQRILDREIYKRTRPGRIVSPQLWAAAHDRLARRRKR